MQDKPLRIGQNSYTNVLPVFYQFDRSRFSGKIDFINQVPAKLNAALANGTIDVGAISSFGYAEHFEHYYILPDLSVSAQKKVRSLYLFSKRPLEELNGAKLRMTNTSATTVNLVKIIFQKFLDFQVTYESHAPNLAEMMQDAEGAVLIGDEAIVEYRNNKTYHSYDLAELWYRFTGLSMTFAVWAVRKEAIRQNESLMRDVHSAFLESKQRSLANLEPLVADVVGKIGGEPAFWFEYFRGLCYDFNKKEQEGLAYYFACATELGLLPGPVPIRIWEDTVQHNTLR